LAAKFDARQLYLQSISSIRSRRVLDAIQPELDLALICGLGELPLLGCRRHEDSM
jgi:hypothetical protein